MIRSLLASVSLALMLSVPNHALAQDAATAPPAIDPEAVKAAEALLKEVAKTYAQAAALSDTIKFNMKGPMGEQSQEVTLRLQGTDVSVNSPGMNLTIVKGALFLERPDVPGLFAQFEVSGDPGEAMQQVIGFAPPHVLSRGEIDPSQFIQAWTFNMLMQPTIAGHALKTVDDKQMHEIAINSMTGDGALLVNPKTHLVEQVRVHIMPTGAPAGSDATGTLTFSPVISQSLEPAIAFDTSGKEKVASLMELQPSLKGKPAPDFTLQTLDGQTVHLADLKGSVVVLDFWATWCVPCKRGLPLLQKFADWVKTENKPVKVYAVNTMEHDPPEQSKPAVAEFWKSQSFTMPTLLDPENTLAEPYMLQSIPLTLIIDTEGIVRKVHLGFDPEMVTELQKDVGELLTDKP